MNAIVEQYELPKEILTEHPVYETQFSLIPSFFLSFPTINEAHDL